MTNKNIKTKGVLKTLSKKRQTKNQDIKILDLPSKISKSNNLVFINGNNIKQENKTELSFKLNLDKL